MYRPIKSEIELRRLLKEGAIAGSFRAHFPNLFLQSPMWYEPNLPDDEESALYVDITEWDRDDLIMLINFSHVYCFDLAILEVTTVEEGDLESVRNFAEVWLDADTGGIYLLNDPDYGKDGDQEC